MELLVLLIGLAMGILIGGAIVLTMWAIVQKKILKKSG